MKYFNFPDIKAAISHYLNNNSGLANILESHNASVAVSGLPQEYDNVPYCTVVNGKMVHTVGEYKAALPNEYDYL
jgi:hypothetical protein